MLKSPTIRGHASPEPPLIQVSIPANSEAAELMRNDPINENTPVVRVFRVLYVFAGVKRKPDVGSHLQELANSCDFTLECHEIDFYRDPTHNVLEGKFWKSLDKVTSKYYDIVIVTPPCNTFSRSLNANRLGPRPMRSKEWPWGFPWLEGAYHFVKCMFELCRTTLLLRSSCLRHQA